MRNNMRDICSKVILASLDIVAIFLSINLAYSMRISLDEYFFVSHVQEVTVYTGFFLIYIITLIMLAYEGIYTRRYDFWHESRQVLKALCLAFLIVLAYLAMTKSVQDYSRAIIVFAFFLMAVIIPLFKNISKKG